jgi:hypothetical protein
MFKRKVDLALPEEHAVLLEEQLSAHMVFLHF